jgi:hypothetical protein
MGIRREIGIYVASGTTAYEATWYVDFVDLNSKSIVARETIKERDPDTITPRWFFRSIALASRQGQKFDAR